MWPGILKDLNPLYKREKKGEVSLSHDFIRTVTLSYSNFHKLYCVIFLIRFNLLLKMINSNYGLPHHWLSISEILIIYNFSSFYRLT